MAWVISRPKGSVDYGNGETNSKKQYYAPSGIGFITTAVWVNSWRQAKLFTELKAAEYRILRLECDCEIEKVDV